MGENSSFLDLHPNKYPDSRFLILNLYHYPALCSNHYKNSCMDNEDVQFFYSSIKIRVRDHISWVY